MRFVVMKFVVVRDEWQFDTTRRYLSERGWTKYLDEAKRFKSERAAKVKAIKYVHARPLGVAE